MLLEAGAVHRQRLLRQMQQFRLDKEPGEQIEHAIDALGSEDGIERTPQGVVIRRGGPASGWRMGSSGDTVFRGAQID
jgi:hypothetical protein